MKKILSVCALALVTSLMGCAATGTVAPQSLDEGLAYAESQVTGLEQSMSTAVASGQLKPAAAASALTIADQITAAITAARASEATGDTSTAAGKLALATSLLSQLAAMLQTSGVSK